MTDEEPERIHGPSDVELAHDLTTSLRADGYTVGFDTDEDVVDGFDDHKQEAAELLEGDDVSSFFLVVERGENADYATSVIVEDNVVWGLAQIQMLGAHFRTVLDALPFGTEGLISAIVDEALTIDEDGDRDE